MSTLKMPNQLDKRSWFNGMAIGMLNIPFTVGSSGVDVTEDDIRSILKTYIIMCFLIEGKKKTLALNKYEGLVEEVTKVINRVALREPDAVNKNTVLLLQNGAYKIRTLNGSKESDVQLDRLTVTFESTTVLYTTVVADLEKMGIHRLYMAVLGLL